MCTLRRMYLPDKLDCILYDAVHNMKSVDAVVNTWSAEIFAMSVMERSGQ